MRAPTDQSTKVWHDRVVQKTDVDDLQSWSKQQQEDRQKQHLCSIVGPICLGVSVRKCIDEAPQIGDQPDLDERRHHCKRTSYREDFLERLTVFPNERP